MLEKKTKYTNKLIHEKSPYLLQHAHNPVNWYAWGPEAFEKAKKEDKPIFLSIGYSTCHWCHVMERESFEDENIARVMNEHFINIKVDREERPDVDQIYMTVVQGLTGAGGWPLSVFMTPELHPFWGGTYFPPENRWGRPGFKDILLELSRIWKTEREKLISSAKEIGNALQTMKGEAQASDEALSEETLRRAYASFQDLFDEREGGFGAAPKFPRSETISLLLRIYRRTGEKKALEMVTKSLSKMARGGIYDHVGGGFHRYSTDAEWLVPHFEKMLYDNALLARAYLEAYQVDKNPMWTSVAREVLEYVLRDMTSDTGGFFSAEDADSEGEEGKYYVWSEEELRSFLNEEEFQVVKKVFQTTATGNFEGKNILHMNSETPWDVRYQSPLSSAIEKIRTARSKRIPPYKDDKILVSWNGLMIRTMAYAFQVLGEERYLKAAQKAARFVLKNFWDGGDLKRRYREGDVRFAASLDDYAFLIQALLDLYETDFNETWYQAAVELQKRSDELFWDSKNGGYFFTDDRDPSLIARFKEVYDGAVPSGNSVAALNLFRFYSYTLDQNYYKVAALFKNFSHFVNSHPNASPVFLMAVDYATDFSKEIVVAGRREDPETAKILTQIHREFLPNKVLGLAGDEKTSIPLLADKKPESGKTTLYVCQNHACQKPVSSFEEAEQILKSFKRY